MLDDDHFSPCQLMEIGKSMCKAVKIYHQLKIGSNNMIKNPTDHEAKKNIDEEPFGEDEIALEILKDIQSHKDILFRIYILEKYAFRTTSRRG